MQISRDVFFQASCSISKCAAQQPPTCGKVRSTCFFPRRTVEISHLSVVIPCVPSFVSLVFEFVPRFSMYLFGLLVVKGLLRVWLGLFRLYLKLV